MKKIIDFILGGTITLLLGLWAWCSCVISSRAEERENDRMGRNDNKDNKSSK